MFLQSEIVLKQKNNNYLLYIFATTIAFIHFHGFPLDLSVVLLKLMFFISGVCDQLLGQRNCF